MVSLTTRHFAYWTPRRKLDDSKRLLRNDDSSYMPRRIARADHRHERLGANATSAHLREPDRHRLPLQLRATEPGHLISLRRRSRHRRAWRGVLPVRDHRW